MDAKKYIPKVVVWGSVAGMLLTFAIAVIIAIVLVLPILTIVYEGPCKFESWDKGKDQIILRLDCQGRKAWTTDVDTLFLQIKNPPAVFSCKVNANGIASC